MGFSLSSVSLGVLLIDAEAVCEFNTKGHKLKYRGVRVFPVGCMPKELSRNLLEHQSTECNPLTSQKGRLRPTEGFKGHSQESGFLRQKEITRRAAGGEWLAWGGCTVV